MALHLSRTRSAGLVVGFALGMIAAACTPFDTSIVRSTPADPHLLLVSSLADDGGADTLRAAIIESNRHPGHYRIRIAPEGNGPHRIQPLALLPAIRGPAVIEGAPHADVVIDGSRILKTVSGASCPGETEGNGPNVRSLQKPGLAIVDTHGVEVANLEIRDFCIGILVLRSSDNHIHDNRIAHQVGAAGVLVTGDDGKGGATSGLAVRNRLMRNSFIDNGDGFEFVRGADHGIASGNTVVATAATETPSQGAEIFSSDDVELSGNLFSGYSDGIQAGGNRHRLLGNTIVGNTNGITTSGTGTTIAGNRITGNRLGIAPMGAMNHVRISRNAIHGNGRDILRCNAGGAGTLPGSAACDPSYPRLGIDLGADGPTRTALAAACQDGFQNFPVLEASSAWSGGTLDIDGRLATCAGRDHVVEVFASHAPGYAGYGEGELYLGSVQVHAGQSGDVRFHARLTGIADPFGDGTKQAVFTATATDIAGGATSEFSAALLLRSDAPARTTSQAHTLIRSSIEADQSQRVRALVDER